MHTVLLRSDGSAVTCGKDANAPNGRCSIAPLNEGVIHVPDFVGIAVCRRSPYFAGALSSGR